jgi:DHA1 family bicyclomycin/chloramphenicol resistance-like MFS transporter
MLMRGWTSGKAKGVAVAGDSGSMAVASGPVPVIRTDHPALAILLGALVAIAPLAMDIYLPSMPAMTRALCATSEEVQLTLSIYMLGWGAAQLFAGPLSDRFGRRATLSTGLVLFTLASIACAFSQDIETLVAARFVQAVAMATVAVVPRAIVRDLHSGDRAAHMLSTMMLVLAVAPVLAPIIGAELQVRFGWQASFVLVALYGAIAWAAVRLALPETLASRDRAALAPARMAANWRRALASRRFNGFLLTNAFVTAGLFAFLAGSAFVFVDALGGGERSYSLYFAIVMIANFVGAWLARRIVGRLGLERVIAHGTALALAAGAAMAALAWIGVRSPWAIVVPMFAYMVAFNWTLPQGTAGAMTPFPDIAGSVSSLLSFAQFVIAAGAAFVVGATFDGTPRPMASAIAASALFAFVAYRTLVAGR